MKTISVITVVFNDKVNIEKTIQSVLELKSSNIKIEYIVLDGNSSDGTWSLIQKYSSRIAYCCSEPDKGIYNAMNKAIDYITGEWCIFINSGDRIVSDALKVFDADLDGDIGVLYGDVFLSFSLGTVIQKATMTSDNNLPSFCHQAAFIRSDLMRKWKYDEKYRICADYDFFKKVHDCGFSFKYIDYPVAYYDMDGISANNLLLFCEERRAIGDYISFFSYMKMWIRSKFQKMFPQLYYSLFYYNRRLKINRSKK